MKSSSRSKQVGNGQKADPSEAFEFVIEIDTEAGLLESITVRNAAQDKQIHLKQRDLVSWGTACAALILLLSEYKLRGSPFRFEAAKSELLFKSLANEIQRKKWMHRLFMEFDEADLWVNRIFKTRQLGKGKETERRTFTIDKKLLPSAAIVFIDSNEEKIEGPTLRALQNSIRLQFIPKVTTQGKCELFAFQTTGANANLRPFKVVHEHDYFFPAPTSTVTPMPSFSNFASAPRLTFSRELAVSLHEHPVVQLVGGPGTGKTVAALQLAFDDEFGKRPVFYLNSQDISYDLPLDPRESFRTIGRQGVVVVLDNAHLQPWALQLIKHWSDERLKSRLVIVGPNRLNRNFAEVRVAPTPADFQDLANWWSTPEQSFVNPDSLQLHFGEDVFSYCLSRKLSMLSSKAVDDHELSDRLWRQLGFDPAGIFKNRYHRELVRLAGKAIRYLGIAQEKLAIRTIEMLTDAGIGHSFEVLRPGQIVVGFRLRHRSLAKFILLNLDRYFTASEMGVLLGYPAAGWNCGARPFSTRGFYEQLVDRR